MFDQTFITNSGKRRPWTYVLGLIGELVALGILMLLPLIYTESLSNFGLSHLTIQTPHGPAPVPEKLMTAVHRTSSAPRSWNPVTLTLVAPRTIPPRPVMLVDDVDTAKFNGVPGAPTSGGVAGIPDGMWNPSTMAPPPERPRPVEAAPRPVEKRASAPIRVSAGVQEAMIVRRVIPIYPPLAKQARVSGTVKLLGVISKDGTIQKLQVLAGHPLLVGAAVDAVSQWVYRPTMLSGEPVEVMAPIEVHFTLSQ